MYAVMFGFCVRQLLCTDNTFVALVDRIILLMKLKYMKHPREGHLLIINSSLFSGPFQPVRFTLDRD